jgi:phage regulator Rha-like protein
MPDLQKPGIPDLLTQLTNFAGVTNKPTTATDSAAIAEGFDPSSPDILKAIATQITKIKETGEIPDEQSAKTLGAAFKSHLSYQANINLLTKMTKAYADKFGASPK